MDVQTTLESSSNGGCGTEESLPPPQTRTHHSPRQSFFHFLSAINELLSALLARGRCGADLSAALAHKTAAAYIFKLGQYASASDAYRLAAFPAGCLLLSTNHTFARLRMGEHPTSTEDGEVYAGMNANWVGNWARGEALIGAERWVEIGGGSDDD
jgi:hypothetical protein